MQSRLLARLLRRRRFRLALPHTDQVLDVLFDDLTQHRDIDVGELFNVQATLARLDLAEPFDLRGKALLQASHEIDNEGARARREAGQAAVPLVAALVDV